MYFFGYGLILTFVCFCRVVVRYFPIAFFVNLDTLYFAIVIKGFKFTITAIHIPIFSAQQSPIVVVILENSVFFAFFVIDLFNDLSFFVVNQERPI